MTVQELRKLIDHAKANISEGNAPLHLLISNELRLTSKSSTSLGELIIETASRELDSEKLRRVELSKEVDFLGRVEDMIRDGATLKEVRQTLSTRAAYLAAQLSKELER